MCLETSETVECFSTDCIGPRDKGKCGSEEIFILVKWSLNQFPDQSVLLCQNVKLQNEVN